MNSDQGVVMERDTLAAMLVVVRAVRTGRLGLRALDEVSDRLSLALDEGRPDA